MKQDYTLLSDKKIKDLIKALKQILTERRIKKNLKRKPKELVVLTQRQAFHIAHNKGEAWMRVIDFEKQDNNGITDERMVILSIREHDDLAEDDEFSVFVDGDESFTYRGEKDSISPFGEFNDCDFAVEFYKPC